MGVEQFGILRARGGGGVEHFGISYGKGAGGLDEDAARGRVWIFSGITQWIHLPGWISIKISEFFINSLFIFTVHGEKMITHNCSIFMLTPA